MRDPLSPARGIFVGCVAGSVMWALIAVTLAVVL